jgi:threonine dehydratase
MGAEVIVRGFGYDAAAVYAHELEADGSVYVSAYDDDDIIAGNGGDLAQEILEDVPDLARVVAPIGGGGMIAGLAEVLCPRGVEVVGAQPRANCAMYESVQLGRALVEYGGGATVAEGCEGAVAERTYSIVARHRLDIVLVEEEAIERAVAETYRHAGQVIECSAAVAVAAVMDLPARDGATVVLVSGGNIDDQRLDEILGRYGR